MLVKMVINQGYLRVYRLLYNINKLWLYTNVPIVTMEAPVDGLLEDTWTQT